MKRVLFIATVTEHINAFHLPYLKWFKAQGWETHVATRGDGDILYCDKKHNLSIERSPFRLGNLKTYFELKSILRKEKFDIIHGHTPMGGMLARFCGSKYRQKSIFETENNISADSAKSPYTRIIYTAHGFHFYKEASLINWFLYYPIEKFLSRYTDDLITINHEDYGLAKRKMKAKHVHYVPGVGVNTNKFLSFGDLQSANDDMNAISLPSQLRVSKRKEFGIPEDATVLISVGELNKNKNHGVVIKALAQLKNNDFDNNDEHCHSESQVNNNNNTDNLYYVICGSGTLHNDLRTLAQKLHIQDRVLFLGQRDDIAELLNMSDIFIFPSLREGLPVSLMEAMASGLPCIASSIRGNVDLIAHEKGGLLIKTEKSSTATNSNPVSGYANAIKSLIDDESLRKRLGKHNQDVVKQFDINVVMKQMQEIYLQSPEETNHDRQKNL